MAINYNDPYNQGLGTPNLGNMNVGQVPMNNMQTAGWWPEILGGTSAEQDAENAALEQIQEIRKNQFEGYPSGTNPAWVEEYKGDYPDLYEKYQDKQKQIQDLKRQFPQNINIQQAYLDDDEDEFSGIEGQTAFLDPLAIETYGKIYALLQNPSKKHIGQFILSNYIKKQGMKNKIGKAEAKEELAAKKPVTTFHPSQGNVGPDPEDKSGWASPGGGGAPSHRTRTLMEKGGRASYFDGGLLSLWPR